ncbi:MAG: hypothetical protein MSA29_03645 [Lachnospiraceae bacterium]|nr:hypothetical protein [Lachnospiraceae bacterium]
MRIMILTANDPNSNTSWEKEVSKVEETTIEIIYKPINSFFLRIIRKMHRKFPIPRYDIWFGEWWKNLDDVDMIIAVAYDSTYRIFRMLDKKYPNIRKILYWWDPVEKTISPDRVSSKICEKWTFNRQDALKYHMLYNPQFFAKNYEECMKFKKEKKQYDIVFFGAIGGKMYRSRIKMLDEFYAFCQKNDIKTCFGLWYRNRLGKKRPFELKYYLNEEEYYKIIMKSTAMLDLTEPNSEWLTLRPIEALYLEKKLITNNKYIINEMLYNKNNIFVLGMDNLKDLRLFLESPYSKNKPEVKEYYSTKMWLNRFINGEG